MQKKTEAERCGPNTNTSVMTNTNTIEIERNAKDDRGRAVWTEHKYKCDDKDKYN